MANLDWYNGWRVVPNEAKKTIEGGKLNGKTDINPMWRIKALTEKFGPCGIGWYTEIVEHWAERVAWHRVSQGGVPFDEEEVAAWVRVRLYVKDPGTGEWSRPIEGLGGSKQQGKGKGDGIDDEAFKMAETDAISVCCKKLGMGADVYWDKDKTKYTDGTKTEKPEAKQEKRPITKKDKTVWNNALAYCKANGVKAKDLSKWYAISDEDAAALQREIDGVD